MTDQHDNVQPGPPATQDDREEELYGLTPTEWAEFMNDVMEKRPSDPSWIGMPRTKEGLLELAEDSVRLNRERHSADDPADVEDLDEGCYRTGPAIMGW